MTGFELDYQRHVRLEFGEYVQTHKDHNNCMSDCTVNAIGLGPTGYCSGAHWFFNLATGSLISRTGWTWLPMPHEVFSHVTSFGRHQGMPTSLAFGNRSADPFNDDDSSYFPDAALDDVSYASYDSSQNSIFSADHDNVANPRVGHDNGSDNNKDNENEDDNNGDNNDDNGDNNGSPNVNGPADAWDDADAWDNDSNNNGINDDNDDEPDNVENEYNTSTGVDGQTTEVDADKTTGVGTKVTGMEVTGI